MVILPSPVIEDGVVVNIIIISSVNNINVIIVVVVIVRYVRASVMFMSCYMGHRISISTNDKNIRA